MTTVAIMQPTYMPWLGLIDMVDQADIWVFLDNVQYERKSWQSRNRILGRDGNVAWLTVPVHATQASRICDVTIAREHPWATRHARTLEHAYGHCEHWRHVDQLARALDRPWRLLHDLTACTTIYLARVMGIQTRFRFASRMRTQPTGRLARIGSLLEQTGATEMLNTAGAQAVLDTDQIAGVPIRWHTYQPVEYEQNGGDFVPHLAALDALARHGPERALQILRAGRRT